MNREIKKKLHSTKMREGDRLKEQLQLQDLSSGVSPKMITTLRFTMQPSNSTSNESPRSPGDTSQISQWKSEFADSNEPYISTRCFSYVDILPINFHVSVRHGRRLTMITDNRGDNYTL